MIAGLNIRGDRVYIAKLDENLETAVLEDDREILEEISECEVVAVNAPLKEGKDLEEAESELIDEGIRFRPGEESRGERARFLQRNAKVKGLETEFIRFDPMVTSRKLAIEDDSGLKGLGVDASDVGSSMEFDAALGAITARFYDQGQCRDLGIAVPRPVHNT